MALRFGTDGVRGVANSELTPEAVLALGRVAARVVSPDRSGPRSWLVGRDTRRSGPLLQAALSAGLAAEGVDVIDLGVIPTPGVAALSAAYGLPGAMISASHNPFSDNGVKLFGAGGRKLDDELERRLEVGLAAALAGPGTTSGSTTSGSTASGSTASGSTASGPVGIPTGAEVGSVRTDPDALRWYREAVLANLDGRGLEGLRVVADCANGAAVVTALDILVAAGADVVALLGARPDGLNINAGCGSTDLAALQRSVVEHRADVGLAFDGDADRVIAVDGEGRVVDGDRLLAIFATDMQRRGCLAGETVVVTVMTNLGFHRAMADQGIAVHQTPVGDRAVLAALDQGHWSLGGEQSGHIIFREVATTGDGVLSGLMLLDAVVRSTRTLADLAASVMQRLPQVLRGVRVARIEGLAGAEAVWAEVEAVERVLGAHGRVLLRPSGTEPLIRVMVEAPSEAEAAAAADRLCAAVVEALGS